MLSIQTFASRLLASLPFEDLLLAGRAAFLVFSFVLAAFAFTRWRRAAERDAAHTGEQLSHALERLERLETNLAQLEPRLAAIGEQIDTQLKSGSPGAAAHGYTIAIRLARAGAQPDELVSSCGLTRQEAELVARLHGPSGDPHKLARRSVHSHPAAA
jgi:hypothetical protein